MCPISLALTCFLMELAQNRRYIIFYATHRPGSPFHTIYEYSKGIEMSEEKNESASETPETSGGSAPESGSSSPPADAAASAASEPAAAKPSRNPLERIIVYGVMLALVGIAYFEYRANTAYQDSLQQLDGELAKADANPDAPLLVDDIDQYLVGNPTKTGPVETTSASFGKHQEYTLTWKSLLREQKLYVVASYVDVDRLEDDRSNVIAIEPEQTRKDRLAAEEAANAPPVTKDD